MPRISIKKKEYNASDLCDWIYLKRRKVKISMEELAHELGMTRNTLYLKLNDNSAKFDYYQLMQIFKILKATDEEILRFMKI